MDYVIRRMLVRDRLERFTISKLVPFLKRYRFDLVKIVNDDSPEGHFYADFQKGDLFLTLDKSFYPPDYQELLVTIGDKSFEMEEMGNCCSTYNIIALKSKKMPALYSDEPGEVEHSFDLIIQDLESYCKDFLEGEKEEFQKTLFKVLKLRGG